MQHSCANHPAQVGKDMGTEDGFHTVHLGCSSLLHMVCATKIQLTTSNCSTDVSETTAELRQHELHATTSEAVFAMLEGVHGGYGS